jgi:hypothetical protein
MYPFSFKIAQKNPWPFYPLFAIVTKKDKENNELCGLNPMIYFAKIISIAKVA